MSFDESLPPELTWSDDSAPGITRRRAGHGFTYRDEHGRKPSVRTLERIRALAVPPAWTDVWICADASGHLQATGRDARHRKQYRYHARYRAHRDEVKFARLHEFGAALPAIRSRVAADLTNTGVPHDKVVATVVRLLETTLVRVGNEEYARANNSYGLTTLRDRHARFTSDGLRLVFKGKHGIASRIAIQDVRLRRVVKQCQDLPGQTLFQYVNGDGIPRPIASTDVNEYLRTTSGLDISAKDFRTWMATLIATVTFVETPTASSRRQQQRAVATVMEGVADALGNTATVARKSYVHPTIVEWFSDGSLARRWDAISARGSRWLLPDERKLARLLRNATRH